MTTLRRATPATTTAVCVLFIAIMTLTGCEPHWDCPCTLFEPDQAPVTVDAGDAGPVEVGVTFSAEVDGFVSGVRFYKSERNTGVHTGSLWTAGGVRLATATFTSETVSGWQQVDFDQPVPVAADGGYVVSYHTDTGFYAADSGYFATPLDNRPLHAPADGATPNGVYRKGASGFPANSYRATNYWVDPVLVTTATDTTAPSVIGHDPATDATGVGAATTVTAQFSEPVDEILLAVQGPDSVPVAGTTAYDAASTTATFTPDTPLGPGTYQVRIATATDRAGNVLPEPVSWSFVVGDAECPCSLWPPGAEPDTPDGQDATPAEVGTRFTTDQAGYLTAVRFHKAPEDTGDHVGHVWNAAGTLLGTAVFANESPSGWQTATLTNPVAVTPGTTYVVSYWSPHGHYAADNGYFAAHGVDRPPLHAEADGAGHTNGVYRDRTSGFPNQSWQATNYWVDVSFATTATDPVPPTVRATDPTPDATGVPANATVTATFDEAVRPDSVELGVVDGDGRAVAGTLTHDPATLTSTFTPDEPFAPTGTYTATVTAARDLAGNPLAHPVTWSFTPGGTTSLWGTATPGAGEATTAVPLELGTRFHATAPGYVTGVRFHPGATDTAPHQVSLWSPDGSRLATAISEPGDGPGWRQVDFDEPVPVSVDGRYVVSYHTDQDHYLATPGYFADAGHCSGALCAERDGDGGGNGVFAEGASTYPAKSYGSANYWVDPLFTASAVDQVAPTVLTRRPVPGATGVSPRTPVAVGFGEPIEPGSVRIDLTGPDAHTVSGTVGYDAPSRVATFTPDGPLATDTTYTVEVRDARDLAGNLMTAPQRWTFTTSAAVPLDGPGGPVLVVTDPTDPSGAYYGEILRAEGLDLFATTTIDQLTPQMLAAHDVVVLASTSVDQARANRLADWVGDGGLLIGMRPDPTLAGLFGLSSTGVTLSNAYLKIDPTTAAGAGLVDEPIQFHDTADLYELVDATPIATLAATPIIPTNAPAVSLRHHGAGTAVAFTYDLARSVVQTRQGNPAWAGQHRLGTSPIRSTDLFHGAAADDPQPDWLDLDRVAIPQADLQQRLLANLILTATTAGPLPRFAYLPRNVDAAVVLTGDDHGHGGTIGRFDQLLAQSPPGCRVDDWTCLRATSYLFPGTPITDAQAAGYQATGFDLGLHTSTECNDFTDATLDDAFTNQLAALTAQLPSIAGPVSNRTHCVPWSTWAGEAHAEAAHGIGLDLNYYWWPARLAGGHPGLFTGSGVPMRLADQDGSLIDVYQVATQITDESDQAEPATIDALLDNATGPLGYHAVIAVNAHTDDADSATADAVVDSARRHDVPVISARQLFTWLQARDRSRLIPETWSDGTARFGITAPADAVGLQAMVPAQTTAAPFSPDTPGTIRTITTDGTPVSFTRTTFAGISYAVFPAANGTYTATYGSDR